MIGSYHLWLKMQNPGYQCRQYWQTPPTGAYWTNTGSNDNFINNHGGGKMFVHMDSETLELVSHPIVLM